MKKFLSLVLALVLTMSLVVVPANAEGEGEGGEGGGAETSVTVNGLSIEGDNSAYPGESKTYRVTGTLAIAGASNVSVTATAYDWTGTTGFTGTSTSSRFSATAGAVDNAVVKCKVTVSYTPEGGEATTAEATLTKNVTIADKYVLTAKADETTLYYNGKTTNKFTIEPTLTKNGKDTITGATFSYKSSNDEVARVDNNGVVTAVAKGNTKITVEAVYGSEPIASVTVDVKVELPKLAITLGEVVNGGDYTWEDRDLESAVRAALDDAVSNYDDDEEVTSLKVSSATSSGGKLYEDDDDHPIFKDDNLVGSSFGDLYFEAKAGFLGDAEFTATATIGGVDYTGTLTIPVVAYEEGFTLSVSAVKDGSYAVFTLPDDYYEYWYIYNSKPSAYRTSGPSNAEKAGDEYRVSLNKFDNDGEATLYVIAWDYKGVASTGELEVVLDSYDIEYSGVAGETITFDQDDFEDMLQEAAKDAGLIGKRSSTAYVEFDHVTFEIPGTKEGVLYNGSSKISKSTKCTDLDKVTFEIASKADSQVCIEFTVTADYYKDNKPSTRATTEYFRGRVVVKVVHEDIKYTVPVDGSVVFKAEDFQDFFDDTYRTGTLSYVKFTEMPKVTDGMLYATYSAIYAGTVAEESDKFYYDSKKVSDYDLDDVTFRTSMWSKAGTKVYIPFTAYGTKSSQSVDGWVVITVENARTMNFSDVKTSDWFYNNVKNAYSMGLIEGKTTTTFNPDDNMTYAEAVTLAARMNQLYYSGKVTLSNSTTGNWYSSYESYAISKGIISSALGNKANTKITRKDYVDIFYNALPASAYTVRNTVSSIPDLANNTANAKVYAFYRAGILTGYANTPGKTNGAFGPNDNIKRSEVATILIRMMDSGTRVYFTL